MYRGNKGILVILLSAGLYCFLGMHVFPAAAEEMLTPENYTSHVILQPAITRIIEDDDIETALKKLNLLHGQMAEDGWVLFNIIEYVDDEDFEGFFVTYVREKE
jgi:hypothetical protein